jgi:hypothetical protein
MKSNKEYSNFFYLALSSRNSKNCLKVAVRYHFFAISLFVINGVQDHFVFL